MRVLVFVCILFVTISSAAEAQCRWLFTRGEGVRECDPEMEQPEETINYGSGGCFQGSIIVVTGADMAFLQAQKCVRYDVVMIGLHWLDDGSGIVDTIDLGNLQWVGGIILIARNDRLQSVTFRSDFKSAKQCVVATNGMFSRAAAAELCLRLAGDGNYINAENKPD